MRRGLIFIAAALVAASCGGGGETATTGNVAFDPTGSWVLVAGTVDGEPLPLVDGWPVTMEVASGRISGTSACNDYGGRFLIDGGTIDAAVTEQNAAGCEPAVMTSEQAFGDALSRVRTGVLDGTELVLTGDAVTLRFATQDEIAFDDVMDREWTLVLTRDGSGAEVAAAGTATLRLGSDGTLRATTGCRVVSGHFIASPTAISITDMGAEGDCPPDLATQDSQVISVLEDFVAEVVDGRLVLTAQGNEGLVYEPAE